MKKRVAFALLLSAGTFSHLALAAKAASCGNERRLCNDSQIAADVINSLKPVEQTFVTAGSADPTRAITVAANELIWQHVREKSAATVEMRAAAAERLIDTYLIAGLSQDAIKLFTSLDKDTRERVVSGPIVFGMADVSELEFFSVEQNPALTAAGLAAAYAEAGHLNEADELVVLASKPVPKAEARIGMHGLQLQIAGKCVRTLIHTDEHTDWFSWVFADEQKTHMPIGCPGAVAARAYARLAAERLESSGLPESWLPGIDANERPGASSGGKDRVEAALKKLPEARARINELKGTLAMIDRQDRRLIAREKQREDRQPWSDEAKREEPSVNDRALAKVLAERLSRPLFNPYRIQEISAKPNNPKSQKPAHCAHSVIRCLDIDKVRWELLMSQDYDPTGEVPAAGYWLRRTDLPNGQPQSFYLGIKEHLPFELVDSDEPFIIDGELRLFVRRAAIDPKQIVFPPVGLNVHSEKMILELRAKLSDIMKDSDGDGLTDLAEQQLLLDPQNPDSDGDGIPDGQDPLPDVAFSKNATPRQRAFAAALAFLTHEPDLAISFGVPGSDSFVHRRSGDERTLFVITDPDNVAGIFSGRRIIVLPSSLDFQLLRKNPAFAVFYPMSISLRMLDDTHAELTYNASWQGGTLAMELHNGVWRIGTLSSWIT